MSLLCYPTYTCNGCSPRTRTRTHRNPDPDSDLEPILDTRTTQSPTQDGIQLPTKFNKLSLATRFNPRCTTPSCPKVRESKRILSLNSNCAV